MLSHTAAMAIMTYGRRTTKGAERYRTSDFDNAKEMADKIYDETEDVVEIRK